MIHLKAIPIFTFSATFSPWFLSYTKGTYSKHVRLTELTPNTILKIKPTANAHEVLEGPYIYLPPEVFKN